MKYQVFFKFKTFRHSSGDEIHQSEEIEKYLNECSEEGFQRVSLDCFENRTTIYASKIPDKFEDHHFYETIKTAHAKRYKFPFSIIDWFR